MQDANRSRPAGGHKQKLSLSSAVRAELASPHAFHSEGLRACILGEPSVQELHQEFLDAVSFSALDAEMTNLARSCAGGSLWCPAADSNHHWVECFSVFASVACPDRIAGVEWWVRRQPAREAKHFHFDKDEQLMRDEARLVTPRRSSVLYLRGAGGPTLIAAQTATVDGELVPAIPTELVAVSFVPNQLLAFSGSFSHGVLGLEVTGVRTTLVMNWWDARPMGVISARDDIRLPSVRLAALAPAKPRAFLGDVFVPLPNDSESRPT